MPTPLITYALIGLNTIIYFWIGFHSDSLTSPASQALFDWGALYTPALIYGNQWWRLVSCLFIHGGIIHLFVNCYSLKNVGPFLEATLGKLRFFLIYFLTGLVSSINAAYWTPNDLIVGASGAIFGIFAAEMGLFIKYRKLLPRETYRGMMRSLAIVLVINLGIGFSLPNISNAGHLGGLISGFFLAYIPFFSKGFDRVISRLY